jgi:hypothetical protein
MGIATIGRRSVPAIELTRRPKLIGFGSGARTGFNEHSPTSMLMGPDRFDVKPYGPSLTIPTRAAFPPNQLHPGRHRSPRGRPPRSSAAREAGLVRTPGVLCHREHILTPWRSAMSADQPATEPGRLSSTASPTRGRSAEWSAATLKTIGAIAIIFPVIWAAYTYYHQEVQQRRQDFLQAYDIVHGNLGKEIAESIDKAISPIYNSTDDKLAKARQSADEAATPADKAPAIANIQNWLIQNILVKDKDPSHDHQIQNYQQALRNLIFLYRYAKTDACTALVVVYRFRETAYLFWYYFPGSYDFDGSAVATSPEPDQAHELVDLNWLRSQQDQCTLNPRV